MITRRRRLPRAFAALTALVTTWCLGCSAFEPLFDALAGRTGGGMVCAAGAGSGATMMRSADGAPVVRALPDHASHAENACGCDGCYAPVPAVHLVALSPAGPLAVQSTVPATPPSVERAPLVPPPQQTI